MPENRSAPPRPSLDVAPPPISEKPTAPARLTAVLALWLLAFAGFLTACFLITLRLDAVLAIAASAERERTAQLIDSAGATDVAHAVEIAVLSIGGAGVAIVLIQLLTLRSLLIGKAKARVLLAILAAAGIIVDYLAYDMLHAALTGELGTGVDVAKYALAAHVAFTATAVLLMFTKPVTAWIEGTEAGLRARP
ncbi:hypothetical protein [Hoyosella subflava]|uniref:Uncharacterized protein n=1 Tax=Hoyosella subflava (strain DSM 45089 / JCM 17490 / NBRC 109087 / DQS3-9A1) TaxID=443218 RepID=F6EJA0_HOYSD|nr:hypothetical protein [Hoyosella subflava]AEF42516.1 hypothetical protein AS9A_4082 [Hoyosella subflava DQS3-9A1]